MGFVLEGGWLVWGECRRGWFVRGAYWSLRRRSVVGRVGMRWMRGEVVMRLGWGGGSMDQARGVKVGLEGCNDRVGL